jgi:hypothetical protein
MLRNKSIFQISTLVCLSSISICNLLIDLATYTRIYTLVLTYRQPSKDTIDMYKKL